MPSSNLESPVEGAPHPGALSRHRGAVIVIGGLGCAVTALGVGSSAGLAASLVFTAVAIWASAHELVTRHVPRTVVISGLVAVVTLQMATAIVIAQPRNLVMAIVGALIGVAVLVPAHLVTAEAVNTEALLFAALVGAALGWWGPWLVGLGLVIAFVLGALIAGPLMFTRYSGRTEFPVVTLLSMSGWLALVIGSRLAEWYLPT
jgi:leader peptidase (prepilin peptidase)/N-methyltransferase